MEGKAAQEIQEGRKDLEDNISLIQAPDAIRTQVPKIKIKAKAKEVVSDIKEEDMD